MAKRTHKLPEPPATVIHDEAAGTIKGALNALMSVSKREDFDVSTLSYMYLEDCPNAALQVAVTRLRERGFTWDDIGRATGMHRAAACKRWGKKL